RNAAEKNYRWRQVEGVELYELERRVTGRVVITNYDPRTLSDAERSTLNARAANNPGNFVLIDIRPGHPGGDWPLFGALKLRSLNHLLDFVAENDVEVREYDVTKDPRSGVSAPNPARTLAIEVSESPPAGDAPFAMYRGRYYTVGDSHWDRRAFTVLYELFQMTVTDVSQVGLPITISKGGWLPLKSRGHGNDDPSGQRIAEGGSQERSHHRPGRLWVRVWGRSPRRLPSLPPASPSHERGVQGLDKGGDGVGRYDGRSRARPARRLGQGLLRCAKRGANADVRDGRLARPRPGRVRPRDERGARTSA